MKSITNYLNAPSNIYKSMSKGAVIMANLLCFLFCMVIALAETHTLTALCITAVIAAVVGYRKMTDKIDDEDPDPS